MTDRDVLIRTIIGEAANEGPEGWAAVAHVVRNRAMDSRWPNSIGEVSLQDKQFSAWNKGAGGNSLVNKYGPGDRLYDRVGAVVDRVLSGQVPDMTGGATHYYSPRGMDALVSEGSQSNRIPRWLEGETRKRGGGTVTIGGHIFTGRAEGTPDNIVAGTNNSVMMAGGGDSSLAGGGADDTLSVDPGVRDRLYDAYTSGRMTPQQRADYEADVRSGRMSVPSGAELLKPVDVQVVGGDAQHVYDAFLNGRMTPQQQQDYIADVQSGAFASPATADQLMRFLQQDPLLPSGLDMPPATPAPQEGGLNLTRQFAGEAGGDLAMAAAGSLTGNNPSPSGIENPIGRTAADIGLTVLGGMGAVGGAAAGVVGDTAEAFGMSSNSAERLSRDLAAFPEALAGSPMVSPALARPAPVGRTEALPQIDVPADHTRPLTRPRPVPPLSEGEAENLAPLIGQAARNNSTARQRLANMAEVDREAVQASQRAGFELPADVFAENPQIQQAVGAVRSVRGSDASAEWETAYVNAQTRAAEIIADEGASPSLSAASERVRESLTGSINQLRADAGTVYDQIEQGVPRQTRAQASQALAYLQNIAEGVGGKENMRPALRQLMNKLEADSGITYGLLRQEKDDIGSAAFRSASIYADSDQRTLTGLYNALSEDQMNFVRSEVGDQAADQLASANELWSSAKGLEENMISAFGKDLEGSIANTLRTSLTNASRGDASRLNRVLNVVPEELQRETLLSALDAVSQTPSGQGGFSAARFAKTYRGLRENAPIYSRVADILGNDTANMLRDVYEVSVRMDRASQRVSQTGASNQAILFADGMMGRVLNGSAGRFVRGGAAAAAASPLDAIVSFPGAFSGPAAVAAASGRVGRDKARAASSLFRSDEFQGLLTSATKTGQPSQSAVDALQNSRAYRRWKRVNNLPDGWLVEAIARSAALPQMEEQE